MIAMIFEYEGAMRVLVGDGRALIPERVLAASSGKMTFPSP